MGTNFWLILPNNGDLTQLCHERSDFCIFWLRFGCASSLLVEKILQKWKLFFGLVITTCLFDKANRANNSKQQNFRFLVLKRKVQSVAARFAFRTFVTSVTILFPFMDVVTLLTWAIPSSTKHVSNNIVNRVSCLFKNSNPSAKLQQKWIWLFFKQI